MGTNKQKKCVYGQCALPKNNNYYVWQIAYLLIAFICLIRDVSQFTSFAVFLFVVPILMDLLFNKLTPDWLNNVRVVFIFLNMLIAIISFLGIGNTFIIDGGDTFSVIDTALFLGKTSILKKNLGIIMLFNLIVPVMFYRGIPNQKTMEHIKELSEW